MRRAEFMLAVLLAAGLLSYLTAAAQTPILEFDFEAYPNNPVVPRGAEGEWDEFYVYAPYVVEDAGTYYMFYTGVAAGRVNRAVGLAKSADGVSWTKHPNNPIFTGYGEIGNIVNPVVLLDDRTWIMYYNRPVNEVGTQIWRATAPAPEGPWLPDEAPVFSSEPPTWDIRKLPIGIFTTEDGYQLFYLGWGSLPTSRMQVGLATSADGITFAAFDDPATTDGIYATSDPVLPAGDEGDWDALSVSSTQIWRGEDGYELFYMGAQQNLDVEELLEGATAVLGYATSPDGLAWTKYEGNPVLDLEVNFWASVSTVRIGDLYYIYYEDESSEIALLTGTITPR